MTTPKLISGNPSVNAISSPANVRANLTVKAGGVSPEGQNAASWHSWGYAALPTICMVKPALSKKS